MTGRLPEISETNAEGKTLEIYEDIKKTLRVPIVNLIYRHMATFPEYLEKAWKELRPNLRTIYVWDAAARIQNEGKIQSRRKISRNALKVIGIGKDELIEIHRTLNFYNGVNPKGMMVITALHQSLSGNPIGGKSHSSELLTEPTVYDEPFSHSLLPMTDLNEVTPEVMALLEEMSQALAVDGGELVIPSLFRHFISWPGFLALIWTSLNPILESSEFSKRISIIEEQARLEVIEWPFPVTVSNEIFKISGYPTDAPENLMTTWHQFLPLIAQMIVLGETLRALLPRD